MDKVKVSGCDSKEIGHVLNRCHWKLAYTDIWRHGTEINVISIFLLPLSFIYKTHQNNTVNQAKSVVNPHYLYSSFGIWYNKYTFSKDTTKFHKS